MDVLVRSARVGINLGLLNPLNMCFPTCKIDSCRRPVRSTCGILLGTWAYVPVIARMWLLGPRTKHLMISSRTDAESTYVGFN